MPGGCVGGRDERKSGTSQKPHFVFHMYMCKHIAHHFFEHRLKLVEVSVRNTASAQEVDV